MIIGTRRFNKFMSDPSSLRYATGAIVSVIGMLVLIGAVLMRVFDPGEYKTIGDALWFTLQTVTTVGYGDNTPNSDVGRFVASMVMLISIGLITVVTAVITSLFIRSATQAGTKADTDAAASSLARIEASLAEAHARLDRIEQNMSSTTDEDRAPTTGP